MSKARLRNVQNLHTRASKINDADIKDKVERVLISYENKYISQFTTAKSLMFTSKDEKKLKKAKETLETSWKRTNKYTYAKNMYVLNIKT